MPEIRFISSSDEHISDLPPGYRKDDYRAAILDKLAWQGRFARKFRADGILRGGDLFHVKAANKTTMLALSSVAEIHRQYPCPTYAVVGNHDMARNDPDSVDRQPIGVLFKSGVLYRLRDELFVDGSMSVRVVGIDYSTDPDYDEICKLVKKKDETYTIAVIHALAAYMPETKIQAFFSERIFDYRDLVFDGCPDAYIFGHYHKDQGIEELHGTKFVNLGAVSRGALTFENLDRRPKICSILCDSRGVSLEEHEIPCLDAAEVFDLKKKEQLDKERSNLDEFIEKFRADAAFGEGGLENRVAAFQESSYPDDLKRLVLDIMETAETEVAT